MKNQNISGPEDSQQSAQKIGRYVLEKELGRGSVSRVYLAYDPFIDRKVAIKRIMISSDIIDSPDQIQQSFFNDVRATGRLMHPNIVTLYDALMEKGTFYLFMEYVHGSTLKELCGTESTLSIEKIINIIFQCIRALDYADKNGVVHQDIKPSNILVSVNDEVKITDFSIAVVESISKTDSSETLSDSAFYTSPEVIRNEQPSIQSDIFSLASVIYELISGVKPFKGETEIAVCFEILNTDPEPLRHHRKDVPEILERIISKAMEKDPEKRYQNGTELANDLTRIYDSMGNGSINEDIELEEKSNALKNILFFKDFTNTELNEVLNATQWLKYDTDDTIITDGEIDDFFYIIVLGDVVVMKNGKVLASLRQGDCFGEMAYLGKTRRAADIKALSKTVLMKVNSSIMENTSLNTQNRFYKVFSRTLIQRLDRVNRMLIKDST